MGKWFTACVDVAVSCFYETKKKHKCSHVLLIFENSMTTEAGVVISHVQLHWQSRNKSPAEVGVVWADVSYSQSNQLLSFPFKAHSNDVLYRAQRVCLKKTEVLVWDTLCYRLKYRAPQMHHQRPMMYPLRTTLYLWGQETSTNDIQFQDVL